MLFNGVEAAFLGNRPRLCHNVTQRNRCAPGPVESARSQ
jgi:hypothetical protein